MRKKIVVEVKIADLRTILNRILHHIEHDLNRKSITLDANDYWEVKDGERYDHQLPTGYGLGNLQDDWDFLAPILEDKELAVSWPLNHASSILRRIGEQVGQ